MARLRGKPVRQRASKYGCLLWQEAGVWVAQNPELHCWGQGKTRQAAIDDLSDAARLMLSYLRDIGEAPPTPRHVEIESVEL
jgi:predicted RNase H-like HicB family nuclease